MSVWQFKFDLIPASAVKNVVALAEYKDSPDGPHVLEDAEIRTFWDDAGLLREIANTVAAYLPEIKSWSSDARMFGDEESDLIQVWNYTVHCRANLMKNPTAFLSRVIELAQQFRCKIVVDGPGVIIEPGMAALQSQIFKSRAYKFCKDPHGYLQSLK